jgi:KDO2-lipid IV(A) lauroyltransferase
VQAKIARARPFADRFHRWAIRRGFPALLWVAPRIPRVVLQAGARFVMFCVFAVYRSPMPDIDRNLARVLGPTATPRQVRRARRAMINNLGCYWADLFRFAQMPSEKVLPLLASVTGFEPVEAALAAGHGALLLTAHLGNWELGSVLLGKRAQRVSVVYVPDKFTDVETFRSRLRQGSGVDEIPIRPDDWFGSLPALRALREGRLLAVQGDRDFNDRGLPVEFLGAPAPFPRGPFALAHAARAPIFPVFIVYTEDRRFAIEIGDPLLVSGPDRDAAIDTALHAWVRILEMAVRRWPTQWYTFYDFWRPTAHQEPAEAAAS